MEAAAKKVQLLAQRILPDRPHHLSVSPDQRFRVPPDHSKTFEEYKYQRLQYMTLLSDADRGMLLTRPYYDMREEPPIPPAVKDSNVKMERKNVTKLSLSDYKNKQKKVSDSPPDSGSTPKTDVSRKERDLIESRIDREPKRTDVYRHRETDASRDVKAHKARDGAHYERTSRPEVRPRAAQDSNDTPEKRKRVADVEGELRPQKRAKPEASTPLDERSRTPRDDTPRRKEMHSSQDRTPQKDGKLGTSSSSLPNGRSALKAALGSGANKSPISRARGDSINGNRPSPSSSGRARTDTASSRSAVPPLLSPLHLPNESDSRSKDKRRDDPGEHNRPQKSLRAEPPPPIKRPKSPVKLPALLSPTLPPMLEEELARMKNTPTKGSDPSQKTQPPDSPTSGKRPHVVVKREEDDRREIKEKERPKDKPRRFMVTLKYSKKYTKSVQRLLALGPPRKDVKKERSVSIEPPPPQARKRPITSTENVGDSIAVKRPRTSEITSSSKLITPSTPSKGATSMSRVASSNSVNTPGDGHSLTPAPPSSDRDRPQTRDDSREAANPHRIQALRDRWSRFSKLGTKLKHERDILLERKHGDRGAPVSDSDIKLSMMLGLETAMAFMVSFRALFESRRIENKAQDPKQWSSILPLLNVMRNDVRKSKPLEALFWQLHGVIHEELIKCYWSLDPATHAVHIIGAERGRSNVWKSAFDSTERVEVPAMRTNMGPWTTVEEAVSSALRIMRRWAQEEGVSWRAEVTVSAANGTLS
ncbi:hypothetical protein CORC01_07107 [Colletotrichum orchidophilum]|uniref:Uncharacterized protein n=1 Tax=Colletotrichum orchidophilum TaxID=1209926 RepID=A0A1G4B8U2_9PEZI|nr:uncharacterized protein CORC01_07107 [Colletotrichum orchidophilum]OHE97692.1 hypothetical protein CORC01_07107 [Colletotrichum orchidophilum]